MSNPWLPGLLRQLSCNQLIKVWQYDAQLREAAVELEKLDKIEQIIKSNAVTKDEIMKIINS
jgi:hypothetical protein